MPKRNEVAAKFHRWMCEDPRFGYTQGPGRWGSGATEEWTCDGVTGLFRVGDRDCSSSTIDCWQEALRGSAYEGALSGATYTGDMRRVFVNSGLFEWKPMSFIAQPGDLYLNEVNHVAMCQTQVPDVLSEFMNNEWGGITGGQVGDQTDGESVVRAFWWPSFGWDGILHYNGKADDDMEAHDVWEYDYEGTAPGGNMYNCVVSMANEVMRKDMSSVENATGVKVNTGAGLHERLAYCEAFIHQINKKLDNLSINGASVDYDKLAQAVADKLAERLKE